MASPTSIVKTDTAKDSTQYTQDFNNLASLSDPSQWVGGTAANMNLQSQTTLPTAPTTSHGQGVLPALFGKIESVGKTLGGLAVAGAKSLGKAAVESVEAPVKYIGYQAKNAYDSVRNLGVQFDKLSLDNQQNNLVKEYSAGRLTKSQYTVAMQQLLKDKAAWNKRNVDTTQDIIHDINGAQGQTATIASDALAILTAGGSAPLTTAVKDAGTNAAVKFLGKPDVAEKLISAGQKIAAKLPDSVVSNVWMRQALTDSTKSAADLTSAQIAKKTALNLLLKRPLVYQTNIGLANDIYDELNNNKYGSAVRDLALAGAMTLSGGPIGLALKQGGKGAAALKNAVFGEQSFIDTLSKRIGSGDASALFNAIKNDPEMVKAFKVMEESNLKATNGQVIAAVNRITNYLGNELGWNLNEMTPEQVAKDMYNFSVNREKVVQAAKNGLIAGVNPDDAERITVGRWSSSDNNQLALMLAKADENAGGYGASLNDKIAAREAVIQELQQRYGSNAAWLNNDNLQKQIDTIIHGNEDTKSMIDAIKGIDAQEGLGGVPRRLAAEMAKDGYIAIMPKSISAPYVSTAEDLGKVKTAFAGEADSMFQKAVEPLPVLGSVGSFISRIGLSPEDSGATVQHMFENNFKANILDALNIPARGAQADELANDMLHKLSDYAKEQTALSANKGRGPIIDYRQMTLKDLQTALGVDKSKARNVRNAIHTAMLRVPIQVRGLGDRVMDYNYRVNPAAAAYSRAQGAWRFVYNPFFRWQQTTQTEMMSQLLAGGKFPTYTGWNRIAKWVFPERYNQLDNTVNMLEEKGVFGGGLSGAGAALEGAGKISTNLLPGEKKSLAGLVQVMAEKTGQSTEDFVNDHTGLVADTLRSLVQYSKHEGFINSPLARTLNFAFFPSRYNLKVAGIMAKYIAQQPAALQVALIKSVMQFSSWLKSDEGQAWYSKNSDAIQLFNWLSPLYPLSYVSKILTGQAHSLGDYGQLGGLPFGMISQMLDSQGVTHLNAPYIQPKTGDVLPDYIPNSMKGRMNAAIQDLLGSLFSYPGATAGLPSKGSVLRSVAGGVIPGSSHDFTKETPTLTPDEQAHSDQIKRVMNLTGANGQPMVPFNGPSIPAYITLGSHVPEARQKIPTLSPYELNQAKGARTATKKKKSEYIPRSIQVR